MSDPSDSSSATLEAAAAKAGEFATPLVTALRRARWDVAAQRYDMNEGETSLTIDLVRDGKGFSLEVYETAFVLLWSDQPSADPEEPDPPIATYDGVTQAMEGLRDVGFLPL